jgi:CheY-like chemotaxis protein
MSNFVTLVVEDDAFQREVLAELLKDDGFEVIECATAEAAELVIASSGTELQALVTDNNLPVHCQEPNSLSMLVANTQR